MEIQPTTRHVEMANGTHAECRGVVQTSVTVGTNSCILRFFCGKWCSKRDSGPGLFGKIGCIVEHKKKIGNNRWGPALVTTGSGYPLNAKVLPHTSCRKS